MYYLYSCWFQMFLKNILKKGVIYTVYITTKKYHMVTKLKVMIFPYTLNTRVFKYVFFFFFYIFKFLMLLLLFHYKCHYFLNIITFLGVSDFFSPTHYEI